MGKIWLVFKNYTGQRSLLGMSVFFFGGGGGGAWEEEDLLLADYWASENSGLAVEFYCIPSFLPFFFFRGALF